jgi:hypothetical protein
MPGCNLRSLLSLVSFTLLACGTFPAAAASCEDLAHVALPNTTITLAQSVAAGAFTPPVPSWASAFMRPTPIPAAFCRVTGSIRYDSMRNPLLAGSAVASTDDGHDGPAIGPTGTDWAFGHPERIIDYGHRAVHLTAVTAKAITGDDPPLVSMPPERQVQGIRRGHRCRELCVRGGIRDGLPEYAS